MRVFLADRCADRGNGSATASKDLGRITGDEAVRHMPLAQSTVSRSRFRGQSLQGA
jgi:hypothetical protein